MNLCQIVSLIIAKIHTYKDYNPETIYNPLNKKHFISYEKM